MAIPWKAFRVLAIACVKPPSPLRTRLLRQFYPGALVNELGFKYIGYVDGHNVPAMVNALEEAKKIDDGPVIVHALTKKGKGYPSPEENYYAWNATGPFDIETGKAITSSSSKPSPPTYTKVFGETMCELMEKDEKIIGLTAAMPDGTG